MSDNQILIDMDRVDLAMKFCFGMVDKNSGEVDPIFSEMVKGIIQIAKVPEYKEEDNA